MSILKGETQTVNYLSFDGSNDYVNVPSIDTNPITISMLINTPVNMNEIDGNGVTDSFLGLFGTQTTTDSFMIKTPSSQNNETNPSVYWRPGTASTAVIEMPTPFPVSQKVWLHFVYSANNLKFYLDDILNIDASVGNTGARINKLGIGYASSTFTGRFQGNIYDFRIWNRALSSQEIENVTNGNEVSSNLYLHYDFSDGSGTTLSDVSGNNNDGTIVGATWQTETAEPAIQNIYYGTNEVSRVYLGESLLFGQSPFSTYELIGDVEITSNTTQIDFDNLNITKDDELRLVWTIKNSINNSGLYGVYPNDETNNSNYWGQLLRGDSSTIEAERFSGNYPIFVGGLDTSSGFLDIKISNNDKFIMQSQYVFETGQGAANIRNDNRNIIGTFNISSINKISIIETLNGNIASDSRLALYKVNKGVA